MKSKYSIDEKLQIVEAYKASGKSQVAFALENGINKSTLASWIQSQSRMDERQATESTGFVKISPSVVKLSTQSITIRKLGLEIDFPLATDMSLLKSIIQVLAAL